MTLIVNRLHSLDPYTEFENVKLAKEVKEYVAGKYGGVGLVISSQAEAEAEKG